MELMDIGEDYYNLELFRTWPILKDKLDIIYDEDLCVNFQFLADCYDEVFDYVMHVNKENIQSRCMGKQEITPGKTLNILRDLYMMLINYIEEKAETFVNVIEALFSRPFVYYLLSSISTEIQQRLQF